MIDTNAAKSSSHETSVQVTPRKVRVAARRERKPFPWVQSCIVVLILGGLSFNGWWYWRANRPIPDLNTIATWLKTQRSTEAESALREHLRRSPANDEARIMLARALGGRGDLLGCARQLHKVAEWSPEKSEALFHEANTYSMLNRMKDAESAWQVIIKDNPLHPAPTKIFHDASAELLKLYATEDRWDDAFLVLWRAFEEADPHDHATLLSWRVRSELERLSYAESIHELRRYVKADPEDWEGVRALAKAEMALGLQAEAERHYKDGLKARPNDPKFWRDYLTMFYDLGNQEAWLAELARVPKSADSEPEIWKFRGIAKEKAGDLAGAAEDFRQAVERNPFIVEYQYRLAMLYERLGKREMALEHRKATQQLREARSDLRTVFAEYLQAQNTNSPKLPAATERLAVICRTLGFTRAADEWTKIANQSL